MAKPSSAPSTPPRFSQTIECSDWTLQLWGPTQLTREELLQVVGFIDGLMQARTRWNGQSTYYFAADSDTLKGDSDG